MVDKMVPYELPKTAVGRHWIWAVKPEMIKTESDAKLNVSIEHPAMWMFTNENVKNSLGQNTSFAIMPGETGISLLPSSEWPQKRAGLSEHNLWVTPYDPNGALRIRRLRHGQHRRRQPARMGKEEPQAS